MLIQWMQTLTTADTVLPLHLTVRDLRHALHPLHPPLLRRHRRRNPLQPPRQLGLEYVCRLPDSSLRRVRLGPTFSLSLFGFRLLAEQSQYLQYNLTPAMPETSQTRNSL